MKNYIKNISAIMCAIAFSSAAHAGVIKIQQDPTDKKLNSVSFSLRTTTLNFDINSLLASQKSTLSDVVSAVLHIYLNDPQGGNERYFISLANGGQKISPSGSNHVTDGEVKHEEIELNLAALNDLKADGTLSAIINASAGELYFDRAVLSVEVPEPASLALLCMGLLGLGAARRRA